MEEPFGFLDNQHLASVSSAIQIQQALTVIDEKKTLTKQDLIEAVAARLGSSKAEAISLMELIFGTLKSALAAGDNVKLSGFGNFTLSDKRARMGRNPQTGERLEISARRIVTFHCSQVLRAEVNTDKI